MAHRRLDGRAAGARAPARARAVGARQALRTQVVATLGLAPLTLVLFQQVSLVGFVANLLAIPLVTLLVTPLALAGALLPPLWQAAAIVMQPLGARAAVHARRCPARCSPPRPHRRGRRRPGLRPARWL